jgi:LacI family transcriptional regulator
MMREDRITVKEVALRAGVSTATVSRAFNNDPRVKSDTKRRVMEAAESLDYRLNDAARSLKTNTTRTIGLVIPYLQNEFFMELAEGIEACLKRRGYHLIISNSNNEASCEREAVALLLEKSVDGLLIIPCREDGSHLSEVLRPEIPTITVDRRYRGLPVDSILADNEGGAYELLRAFLEAEKPVKTPAFIGGHSHITTADERLAGFTRALKEAGYRIEDSPVLRDEFDKPRGGYRAMKLLYETAEKPLHIFIANYFMHVGASEYLLEKGVSPSEVRIAAFDYSPMYPLLRYCSLYISQPRIRMGEEAVSRLLDFSEPGEGGGTGIVRRLPTELIRVQPR